MYVVWRKLTVGVLLIFAISPLSTKAQNAAITGLYPGRSLFRSYGLDAHIGINGIGFDVATPVARQFNVRVGADFFGYSTSFQEEGANVDASLHFQSFKAALDWFPFANGFRVSPLLVFANNNRARVTAVIPAGSSLTLNGSDYISSPFDPLHGSGSVDFRKIAPGLSIGWGNIVPMAPAHFSFPVEIGFYYVGQPRLQANFTGSACDPRSVTQETCESVDDDPGFQKDLQAFRARNNNNLSYASFFPIVSFGIGYRF